MTHYSYFIDLLNDSLNLKENKNVVIEFLLEHTNVQIKRQSLIYLNDKPNHCKQNNFEMIKIILNDLYENKHIDLAFIDYIISNMLLHNRLEANSLYDYFKFKEVL